VIVVSAYMKVSNRCLITELCLVGCIYLITELSVEQNVSFGVEYLPTMSVHLSLKKMKIQYRGIEMS
jgi:hypothetical protein